MAAGSYVLTIIPTFNRAHYLPDAVNSALEQDYPFKKILIVDDGSTDNTKLLCAELIRKHGPVVSYFHQENAGCASARNLGLANTGDDISYVCFLDSDDKLLPGKLSREVELLEKHPEAGFTYSDAIVFDELSGIEERQRVAGADDPADFVLEHFLTNAAKPSAILYRADTIRHLRFRQDLLFGEDSEFLQRIAQCFKGVYCSTPGCWMRWHQHSKSRKLIEILKAVLQSKNDFLAEHPKFYLSNKAAIDRLMNKTRKLLATQLLLAKRWDEVPVYTDSFLLRAQAKLRFSGYQWLRQRFNLWFNKRHLIHH